MRSMMTCYYKALEHEPYIEPSTRAFLADKGIRIIPYDEAHSLVPTGIFSNYVVEGGVLAIPNPNRINTPIPFEPMDHKEHFVDGRSLEEILENYISDNFSKKKYLFSADPNVFLAIELGIFSYSILENLYTGHMTTPIVVFDDELLHAIYFENDFAINTISIDNSCGYEVVGEMDRTFWVNYFNANFLEGISYGNHGVNLINKYYRKSIDGLRMF